MAVWHKLKPGVLWQPGEVGCGKEVQEGEDICIPMANSRWCMAETNIIKQLCSLLKINLKS